MSKRIIAFLLIALAIYWSFSVLLPNTISDIDTPDSKFSTHRALVHLKAISKQPHYVGNANHSEVRNYLISELKKLGLETQVQEGYSMGPWGNLSKAKNILARIKGRDSGKALLLLSHYDSNPHSSFGASDAGSGIVTILEGVRAFLTENKTPKNDIIILFSDAEELGLNGADIFVNQHPWAKDVGLVLNFEARGSGGPSYMLIETNQGNASLMKHFVEANPEYPVANSLAYSIYKMLPNDTDLTRFREDGDIDGFNFAFIDDHFDYHTALDTYERLDRNTLEHQGSYLMPLLYYFADADLTDIKNNEDHIYFNVPLFKTVIYPFSWIMPMLILSIVLFVGLIVYGLKKESLSLNQIGKGFIAFFTALILSAASGFVLWKLLLKLYPQYQDMLHGFTYNGHTYIAAFTCLALAICFMVYHKFYASENTASLLIAPLAFWIVICGIVALALKGASFFIIPVLFGLLSLLVLIRQKEPNIYVLVFLSLPVITIMAPLVKMFPVGLGLKILFVSCVLVVLIFGLTISVFGSFPKKNRLAYLFLSLTIACLAVSHGRASFSEDRPKPNSLLYVLNANNQSAVWATYDNVLDDWTKAHLTDNPEPASELQENTIGSKYKTGFTFTNKAELKSLPEPSITILQDTVIGDNRDIVVQIKSNRQAERFEVFSDSTNVFKRFTINGVSAKRDNNADYVFEKRFQNRLFSYYVSDNEPLEMHFVVPKNQQTRFTIYEATFNLLEDQNFEVSKRQPNMIPKPFVLNDAVVVKKQLTIK
ncbi:M28 family peptidase [Hanstruepera marina]|uniref:M28 family peptidase n=1 Tax=Hanstruepera marina TaxID=2873265 RepID=UPI001CA7B44D|nr:M28 family peptidase [Hanstruepera marina]